MYTERYDEAKFVCWIKVSCGWSTWWMSRLHSAGAINKIVLWVLAVCMSN